MKFLFVGDAHNQVRTPGNRKDDFHETYQEKVKELKEIALEEGVTAVLQPGDFLNSPQYNNDFLLKVVSQWSFVPEKYELLEQLRRGEGNVLDITKRLQEDIPYIGAIGNHELIGESLKSYPKTSLAFLEKIGFMQLASKENPIIFTQDDGTTVAITATHYHHGMDEPDFADDYIVEEKAADIHIHMVHGFLSDKNLGTLIKHTLVDAVKETKADITLAGHDHIGFAPIQVDGKWFSNPGSLTRTKADVKEIARQPKVLLIELDGKEIKLTERPLKCAQLGNEVLDRTSIIKKAAKASKIESIKSIVNKASMNKGQSVTDIIEAVANADGIDKEITEDVVSQVTDKIETMKGSETSTVEPYHLSQIVLENFQSHERTIFDVHEGLNIFTGESSNGKSAVMRAMRWLLDNAGKSQRESFIRHGADKAKVTAVFENGAMVSRVLERKGHGANGWEIYDPTTGEIESGNTQLADQIREIFGYTKVQYDTNDALDVNFMNQGDGWYFIGEHVKSSERAKIIGAIFGTHYTDAVMKDIEKELRNNRSEARLREKDAEKVTEELEQFDYLDDLETKLKQAKVLLEKYAELEAQKQRLEHLIEKKEQIEANQKKINEFLAQTHQLDEARSQLDDLKVSQEHHAKVVQLLQRRARIIHEGQASRKLVAELKELEVAVTHFAELQKKAEVLKEVTRLAGLQQRLLAQGKVERNQVDKASKHIDALQKEYKDLLEESGSCPTCGQSIDEHILDEFLVSQTH